MSAFWSRWPPDPRSRRGPCREPAHRASGSRGPALPAPPGSATARRHKPPARSPAATPRRGVPTLRYGAGHVRLQCSSTRKDCTISARYALLGLRFSARSSLRLSLVSTLRPFGPRSQHATWLRQAASQLLSAPREAEMLTSEGLLKARAC